MTLASDYPSANTLEEKEAEGEIFHDYYTREAFDWWVQHPYRHHTLRHLAKYLGTLGLTPTEKLHVIEPACGCGVNLTNFARDYPNFEYFGVDLSPEGVATGNKWGAGKYQVGDAENIPVDKETFDVCLCVAAVHHFHRDPRRFLSEMYRVLRKGGILYLFEPCRNLMPFGMMLKLREKWVRYRIDARNGGVQFTGYGAIPRSPTEGPFNKKPVMQLFEEMGFTIEDDGHSEYLSEWARHYKEGHDLAVKFDRLLKPKTEDCRSKTGGTKYYAILRK
jgi:SAM-dependent methyltransferase